MRRMVPLCALTSVRLTTLGSSIKFQVILAFEVPQPAISTTAAGLGVPSAARRTDSALKRKPFAPSSVLNINVSTILPSLNIVRSVPSGVPTQPKSVFD